MMFSAPPKPRPRTPGPLLLAIGAAMLTGCAAKEPRLDGPAAGPPVVGDRPPGDVQPGPEAADLSARSASVEVTRRAVYRSRGADPATFLLIERSAPAPGPSGRVEWTVRRWHGPAPDGPWTPATEQAFELTGAGDAAIAGETNHLENVGLAFTPPMVVMPSQLIAGGAPFIQTTSLRVWPLDNPRQTKAQGQVRQEIRHAGAEAVQTPSGAIPAQRVEQLFEADLKPAQVRNLTRQWFVPGAGLIAETREERTRVFAVPTRQNRESWVLLEPP